MSEPKFTPGPWQQDGSHIYGPDPLRRIIAQISYAGRGYQSEDAANEKVILAAPELYKAATLACLTFERAQKSGAFLGDDECEAWTALEKAVAKAEGRHA